MKKQLLFLTLVCILHPAQSVFASNTTQQTTSGFSERPLLQKWKERRQEKLAPSENSTQSSGVDNFQGREIILHIPRNLPAAGTRAMVVALHGGGGNAEHIQKTLSLDAAADEAGFIVAYLNGTRAGKRLSENRRTWNAGGGCCGLSAENNVDDIGYITQAVPYLAKKYGIDRSKIFGMGHSNGAMMTQRLMCETDLYAAAVAGPFNIDVTICPYGKGKRILAIHGEQDKNVLIEGGSGPDSRTGIDYNSQAYSEKIFEASGTDYELDPVKDAPHQLEDIDSIMLKRDGRTMGQTIALFFGIGPK